MFLSKSDVNSAVLGVVPQSIIHASVDDVDDPPQFVEDHPPIVHRQLCNYYNYLRPHNVVYGQYGQ
jgi:hypothetical protein